MPGPAPKPDSQRRRSAKPKSYGAASPTTVSAGRADDRRDLGIDNPHPLIASLWDTVQQSVRVRVLHRDLDWQRLRLELWYANRAMASSRPTAKAWT